MSPVAQAVRPQVSGAVDRDWWRGAVIYQIYPRSFQDSNGDGVGDLPGIVERLPYVASLGVNGIWISPFFRSAMLDFGYDIIDHRDVDPLFGSMEDFDALIARAHDLGLKVMIDLVLSHTSDRHPWFQESRQSRDGDYADWYVWADARPDGTPPNNWLSVFGGSAWEWDGERMQYYLHNFLREQPDLNFHNPAVQAELLDIARFWLERGVDGFRLDTVNFYFHDPGLRDNPALALDLRNDSIAPSVNPYNWQEHIHDRNRPENLDFLRQFRSLLEEFPGSTTLGEVGDSRWGTEIQAEYTSGGDRLHMCYSFEFLSGDAPTGTRVAGTLEKFEALAADGWACWAFSNHDVMRHATRWKLPEPALRLYSALLLCLRGSACLYQGEELGLTEARIPFEDLRDPYGIRFWPGFNGRDGSRTPMVWAGDGRAGGFSEAKPWLPIPDEHLVRAVDSQENDRESILGFYRAMLSYRSRNPVLVRGGLRVHEARQEYLSLVRELDGRRMFCAFNLSGAPQEIALPEGRWTFDANAPFPAGDGRELAPWHALFGIAEET
ncbi:MAG: alpha glucosidase [Rhodobacter sp.]|nr:alpha glucosidase [Rhodobacter sp.]